MAEVKNNFIRSKMNKDLDARLVPPGEYRNAINAQISKSEGEGVGSLENVLGNISVASFEPTVDDLSAVGFFVDEVNNHIYVFLTDNSGSNYVPTGAGSNHFIKRYNASNGTVQDLVSGAFLNFSKLNPIYGVNLLENLLFFTDNRNQPRKINVSRAVNDSTYYYNEDQISVAKYNPYSAIKLYEFSQEAEDAGSPTDQYQTTMKDVVSKFIGSGGTATVTIGATGTSFTIGNLNIPFYPNLQSSGTDNLPQAGMRLGKITTAGGPIVDTGATVTGSSGVTNVQVDTLITLATGDELVFNYNPYYDPEYSGDDAFLEDKFVRFSYRFKFDDNEYSLIAPFTQPCFIPKQDGYFLNTAETEGDQQQAVSSTIVSFMENKVNSIGLQIPLPTFEDGTPMTQDDVAASLKIKEIDIIYKESDGLSMKVVESIPVSELSGSDTVLEYIYVGKKPYKTIPEKELARVYDVVPVKSLAQEVVSNRVVYSNFQNRHTPPVSLDYNVAATEKSEFNLRDGSAVVNGDVIGSKTINLNSGKGTIEIGSKVSWSGSPDNIIVQTTTGSPIPTSITVTEFVNVSNGTPLDFQPSSDDKNLTSIIEYPNHTLKTNRSYQVGIVLSDRYGRTSDVILSNNKSVITIGTQSYSGPSLFSPYIDESYNRVEWPGNSLKISFNSVIGPNFDEGDGEFWPGLYNGDSTSEDYNPLGWYTYKVVVQQKEQEYYNVYTAGAIKGDLDPGGALTPNQNQSYVSLINDNINKVPRDLSEVGPQQKSFRSSVQLFGRVENTDIAFGNDFNQQYYPGRSSITTSSIQNLFDLFDVDTTTTLSNADAEYALYKAVSNPITAEFTTSFIPDDQFGVVNGTASPYVASGNLAVLETEPVVSLLDIYYESSTSGLINDLNYAISNDTGFGTRIDGFVTTSFTEAVAPGDDIVDGSGFELVDEFGVAIDPLDINSFSLISVYDSATPPNLVAGSGVANPYFILNGNQAAGWNIEVTSDFVNAKWFGSPDGQNIDAFTRFVFNFQADIVGEENVVNYQEVAQLRNVTPVIYDDSSGTTTTPLNVSVSSQRSSGEVTIDTFYGRNGALSGINPNTGYNLTWQIINAVDTNGNNASQYFNTDVTPLLSSGIPYTERCELIVPAMGPDYVNMPISDYQLTLRLSDAGQDIDEVNVNIRYGLDPVSASNKVITVDEFGDEEIIGTFFTVYFQGSSIRYVYTGSFTELLNDSQYTTANSIIISNINTFYGQATGNGYNQWYQGNTMQAALDLAVGQVSDINPNFVDYEADTSSVDVSDYGWEIQD